MLLGAVKEVGTERQKRISRGLSWLEHGASTIFSSEMPIEYYTAR